jgi:hypothetical protein
VLRIAGHGLAGAGQQLAAAQLQGMADSPGEQRGLAAARRFEPRAA